MLNIEYNETCYECGSLSLRLAEHWQVAHSNTIEFEVVCRECNTSWIDFIDGNS